MISIHIIHWLCFTVRIIQKSCIWPQKTIYVGKMMFYGFDDYLTFVNVAENNFKAHAVKMIRKCDPPAMTAGLLCPPSGFTHSSRLNSALGSSTSVTGFSLSCSLPPLKYKAVIQDTGTLGTGLPHEGPLLLPLPPLWSAGLADVSKSSTSPEKFS